jgi:hypothetical protein
VKRCSRYHDQYHPRVKHDVKKLHATLREAIQTQHLPDILAHPEQGEPLVGDVKGIWSYHFSFTASHGDLEIGRMGTWTRKHVKIA